MRGFLGSVFVACSFLLSLFVLLQLETYETSVTPTPRVAAAVTEITDPNVVAINTVREKYGRSPLLQDKLLLDVAQVRVTDMVSQQYYSHVSPQGKTYSGVQKISGLSCENLLLHTSSDITEALQQWLQSPAHKDCLLHERTTKFGVSVRLYDTVHIQDGVQELYIFTLIAAQ